MDDSWKRTSDWHKVDELMMDLLKRIAFEGNIRRSTILFYFAAKFGALPYQKCSIIDELNAFCETEEVDRKSVINVDWHLIRNEYQKCDSFIIYKWVKKMLLLISNQNMFYGEEFEIVFNLQVSFHHSHLHLPHYLQSKLFAGDSFDVHCVDLFYSCDTDIVTNFRYADEIRSYAAGMLPKI